MDFSTLKKLVIPEGEVTKITSGTTVLWEAITFTNQVPISTDTDGSIFNGTGYKENVRLSSSGGISGSAQNGSVTTGFMPFKNTDVFRLKGAEWVDMSSAHSGHHFYFNLYDANKKFITDGAIPTSSYSIDSGVRSQFSAVYDATTGVTTFSFINPDGGTGSIRAAAKKASYFRINAYGKGADMIVTINEEID